MYNIKFMGQYKNESQILHGLLPTNATQFEEPNKTITVFFKGTLILMPFIAIVLLLIFAKFKLCNNYMNFQNAKTLPQSIGIAAVMSILLVLIHQILHAICFPKKVQKEIWFILKSLSAFVYCNHPISKRKYLWICICPNVFLCIIPFFLWLILSHNFNNFMSQLILFVSLFNMFSGIGDYYNIYLTLKQVPKNSIIQNYGIHTYWY